MPAGLGFMVQAILGMMGSQSFTYLNICQFNLLRYISIIGGLKGIFIDMPFSFFLLSNIDSKNI